MADHILELNIAYAIKTLTDSPKFDIGTLKNYAEAKIKALSGTSDNPSIEYQKINDFLKDFEHFQEHKGLKDRKIRGLVEGVFDMAHFGHFNAIRQAKKMCDELVVAINVDEEVHKHKGFANKPYSLYR